MIHAGSLPKDGDGVASSCADLSSDECFPGVERSSSVSLQKNAQSLLGCFISSGEICDVASKVSDATVQRAIGRHSIMRSSHLCVSLNYNLLPLLQDRFLYTRIRTRYVVSTWM